MENEVEEEGERWTKDTMVAVETVVEGDCKEHVAVEQDLALAGEGGQQRRPLRGNGGLTVESPAWAFCATTRQ